MKNLYQQLSRAMLYTMIVGIDIGGTKTLVARFNQQGEIETESEFKTDINYESFLAKLCSEITAIARDPSTIKAIGVAAPGIMDYKTSRFKRFGNRPWRDIDLKVKLENTFNIPVSADNDANMGAVGEANLGAGVDYDEILYITVSTGIGTGITTKKTIDPALADSEGGMMVFPHEGQLKVWEKFASGKAFVERFGIMGKDTDDPEIWKTYARDLSMGIASLIAVIQPEAVIIGGSMGEHFHKYKDYLLEDIMSSKADIIDVPPIMPAKDPHRAVIYGCYVSAREMISD